MTNPILANAIVELFHAGGLIMWPIAAVTFFAIAVLTERLWWWIQFSRSRKPKDLVNVFKALEAGEMDHAISLSEGSSDAVVRVVHAGITHRHARGRCKLQLVLKFVTRGASSLRWIRSLPWHPCWGSWGP